jgi:hypothetical protein
MEFDEQISGWEIILKALPLVFNSDELTNFQSLTDPASQFLFHNSILPSRSGKPRAAADFFKCCVKVMQPLLSVVQKPDSVEEMEEALGPNFIDALSHLAALSSIKLQPMIDDVDREHRVSATVTVVNLGMNATNSTGTWDMIGRIDESTQFDQCIRPVFANDNPPQMSKGGDTHSPIVLVHGMPGVGKSFFAGRKLEKLQKKFDRTSPFTVYRHTMHGRGAQAVRDGLYSMGLALAPYLEITSATSKESALGSLKMFLGSQRYVIMVDDIDPDGMRELFDRVPKSLQHCALILTTQWKYANTPENELQTILLDATKTNSFTFGAVGAVCDSNIELCLFSEKESMDLVKNMCSVHQKFILCMNAWLTDRLQHDMGQLPIAVHIFAVWLRQQFELAVTEVQLESPTDLELESPADPKLESPADLSSAANVMSSRVDKIKQDWSQAATDESLLESTSSGFRGLRATVRLLLHTLKASSDYNFRDDSICFLKIMALTDPNDVNIWSLFEPEVPFLYVTPQWASLVPQVHFRKNFAETKKPLLRTLVDPKFSLLKFFEKIMKIAPLLTTRNPDSNTHGHPCIISMHQLIQNAVLAELGSELPESDVILLELMVSRVRVGKSIYSNFNEYYFGIAHTAKLILHNLEEKQLKLRLHNPYLKTIDKERINFRMALAALFHRLGLDRESFALVSQILEHDKFPFVTLQTFSEVVGAQYSYSESIIDGTQRWMYLLRKLQIQGTYLFSEVENIRIKTRYLRRIVPCNDFDAILYFLNESSKIFNQIVLSIQEKEENLLELCQSKDKEGSEKAKKSIEKAKECIEKAKEWLSKIFVDGKILRHLLKESKGNQEMQTNARALSRRIYEFLDVHECFYDKRAIERNLDDVKEDVKAIRSVKIQIQKQFFDLDNRKEAKLRLRHSTDWLDYRYNYVYKSLAEAHLNHAFLLPLNERFMILSCAIESAHEAQRCSYATKASGNINVDYRRQLLGRCYGAYASTCDDAHGTFKKSLFYYSLALISLRKFNDVHKSRMSLKWLEDCQCQLSATLWQMQVVLPDKRAVTEYLKWLKDGFNELKFQCTLEEVKQLHELDPFDANHPQELRNGSCEFCQKNFEYLMGPRNLQPEFKAKCIVHYEILTMLLQRMLQGGYFVRRHDLRDEKDFARTEIQKRLKMFEFFVTLDQTLGMNSDQNIFVCAPIVKSQFWLMIFEDFTNPCEFSKTTLDGLRALHPEPSLSSFQALADLFCKALCDDGKQKKLLYSKHVFGSKEIRMLQCSTFDQRANIIQEMEQKTNFQAKDQMLKILFQATDVMNHRDRALRFVEKRHIRDFQVLAPLLRLCAECNRRDCLIKFWNSVMEEMMGNTEWLDWTNQLYACFYTLPNPNLTWHQLIRLVDPDAKQQWAHEREAHAQGADRRELPTSFRCCLRNIPDDTTQADIAKLFEIVGIQYSSIKVKASAKKASVNFITQNDLELALAMDKFVPFSGARPISFEFHEEKPHPSSISASAGAGICKCDIGVKFETKRKAWVHAKIPYSEPGVYITVIFAGKGADLAKIPIRSRLVSVGGQAIKFDQELAETLLSGVAGTQVNVEVRSLVDSERQKYKQGTFWVTRLR